ncbi:hypothetical protein TNCV_1728301 [Trichonephila clavipes]|nr:hypothetical protein TNCV_1728301 [Trichonephila clavipes]
MNANFPTTFAHFRKFSGKNFASKRRAEYSTLPYHAVYVAPEHGAVHEYAEQRYDGSRNREDGAESQEPHPLHPLLKRSHDPHPGCNAPR